MLEIQGEEVGLDDSLFLVYILFLKKYWCVCPRHPPQKKTHK